MADLSHYYRYLSPHVTILVTTGKHGSKDMNIVTLAWHMPVSMDPPLHAISIRPSRYSMTLIEKYREWVVNLPTMDMLEKVHFCGTNSGKTVDKFKATGLTPVPSKTVSAPSIKECPLHLECKLHSRHTAGDHEILVGEVVHMVADPEAFGGTIMDDAHSHIGHMGGNDYMDRWGKVRKAPGKRLN